VHKKNHLLILAQLPPPVHGASVMNKLVVETCQSNHQLNVRTINISPVASIDDIGLFRAYKLIHSFKVFAKVAKALVFFPPTLVYFTIAPHGFAFFRDALIVTLVKFARVRRVLHLHGKGVAKNSQRHLLLHFLYKWTFSGALVIALSEKLKADIANIVPNHQIRVVANGIDADAYTPSTEYRAPEAPLRVLFLSNMVRSKGPIVLLRALRILKERQIAFCADFVGPWLPELSMQEFGKTVTELDLEEEVFCWGAQYDSNKQAFLKNADVLAFPTFYANEAFPLVILEAMAAGLPIVSTTEGGIPDMIVEGRNGFLAEPKHALGIADALTWLAKRPSERKKMGAHSRLLFEEKYTLDIFTNAIGHIVSEGMSND